MSVIKNNKDTQTKWQREAKIILYDCNVEIATYVTTYLLFLTSWSSENICHYAPARQVQGYYLSSFCILISKYKSLPSGPKRLIINELRALESPKPPMS